MLNIERLRVFCGEEEPKGVASFDTLVNSLKGRMIVDPYMRPVEGLDYEKDLTAWVDSSFVRLESETAIRVEIETKKGRGIIVDSEETKIYASLDEPQPLEARLFGIALAKAKLELVKETIKDVYPALGIEAGEYLSYLDQMKNEVLGVEFDKKSKFSLSINAPVSFRRTMVITALILVGSVSVAKVEDFKSEEKQKARVTTMVEIEKPNEYELEVLKGDDGYDYISQKGFPYAFRYGYGHLFRAAAVFDENSDCSEYGVGTCEGVMGYAHGTEPGSAIDGFEVRPDPNYQGAFLYFPLRPKNDTGKSVHVDG